MVSEPAVIIRVTRTRNARNVIIIGVGMAVVVTEAEDMVTIAGITRERPTQKIILIKHKPSPSPVRTAAPLKPRLEGG